MSELMPADDIASEISSLQTRISGMQDSVRLKDSLTAVANLQTTINSLPQVLAKLRSKGYVFEKSLELQAGNFVTQWAQLYPTLIGKINTESAGLQAALQTAEGRMTQLNSLRADLRTAEPLISAIKNELQGLEDNATSAANTIMGIYSSFSNEFTGFKQHLDQIDFMLSQLNEAKFALMPTEGGLRATKASWYRDGKKRDDDPTGILYLTDQRILFEQKEEIATKKVLFITTAKQLVHELKWEAPVALIDEITPSKQGFLKNEDHLDLRFKSGAPHESIHVHIWQDGTEWLQLIKRALTRDFDMDRVVAIDQDQLDKLRNAPTKCPSCGANITQPILRGQESIKCEFCGFMIRI